MKRLIRKQSEVDINKFLREWLTNFEFMGSYGVEQLIEQNPDCLYSGNGYRVLTFFGFQLHSRLEFSVNEQGQNVANKESIVNALSQKIKTGDYQSFSKSQNGVFQVMNDFNSEEHSEDDLSFMISSNLSNGLDLGALCAKYKNELNWNPPYERYEEIIAKLDNYEVIGLIKNGQVLTDFSLIEDEDGNLKCTF